MDSCRIEELKAIARNVRLGILEETYNAGSGHPGGSLSCTDILTYLYFEEMKVRPEEPKWVDRDRFVLSKGHAAPALYAVLAEKGFFPKEQLKTLRKIDSMLQGHPDMNKTPGVDISTGSLGIGLSNACGMALAARLDRKDLRVYTITGDGELEEGQIWEAAMFASHYSLDNLYAFVDANGLQIDGKVDDVKKVTPLSGKFQTFGWHVINVDGHSFPEILAALDEAKTVKGQPTAIIAKTHKGHGVSFMEDQAGWHGKAPNDEQFRQAMEELGGVQ